MQKKNFEYFFDHQEQPNRQGRDFERLDLCVGKKIGGENKGEREIFYQEMIDLKVCSG